MLDTVKRQTFQDRFDHSQYVSLTMEFRCNLKCVHCMIEDTMDRLAPTSRDEFEELLKINRKESRWKGLILTGSEITLMRDLPELAQKARASGFEHIRIQTHGMHLGQPSYTKKLIDAGVDEFFVSVAGANAATHDMITVVNGSFDRTVKGLENIDHYSHAISITNTVVTRHSYKQLPHLVKNLSHIKNLIQMEFWVYFPMAEKDEKNLLVSHSDLLPYLLEAIELAHSYNRSVEIKNFPSCMLGKYSHLVINAQPMLFIDPDFWKEFERNGFYQCPHRQSCDNKECLGLNTAYINKFGIDESLLQPIRLKTPEASSV